MERCCAAVCTSSAAVALRCFAPARQLSSRWRSALLLRVHRKHMTRCVIEADHRRRSVSSILLGLLLLLDDIGEILPWRFTRVNSE